MCCEQLQHVTTCRYIISRILGECKRDLGLEDDVSSDEEIPPKSANQIAEEEKDDSISEEDYHRMLRKHHQKRLLKRVREGGREGKMRR